MMPMAATLVGRSEGEAQFTLFLEPDLPAFQGHFPGDPVLPGVVQVDWAIRLGREAFGDLGAFQGLEQIKFVAAARPSESLNLHLAWKPGRLTFKYQGDSERKSSGTVLFERVHGIEQAPGLGTGQGSGS